MTKCLWLLFFSPAFFCDTLLHIFGLPLVPVCKSIDIQQQSGLFKAHFYVWSTLFTHCYTDLTRGHINNPWILSPCVNAVPTYKCNSLVGHSFDTFQSFSFSLACSGSWSLIDDIKRSGEIWGLDVKITDWLRMTQSFAESQFSAAWRWKAWGSRKERRYHGINEA